MKLMKKTVGGLRFARSGMGPWRCLKKAPGDVMLEVNYYETGVLSVDAWSGGNFITLYTSEGLDEAGFTAESVEKALEEARGALKALSALLG